MDNWAQVKTYINIKGTKELWYDMVSVGAVDRLKEVLPWTLHPENGLVVFVIPEKDTKWLKDYKQVAYCGFEATNRYLSHNLGVSLDVYDKDWYRDHPKTNNKGLPEGETLQVLHELVFPYEIGISRVLVLAGTTLSDSNKNWMNYLGVNPVGQVDHQTDNEEYLEQMSGGDPAVKEILRPQMSQYKFEFTKKLPTGRFATFAKQNPDPRAPGGGHVSYHGPRGVVGHFTFAVQYDYLEFIKYHVEPVIEVSKADEALWKIDFWKCLTPEGKPLSDFRHTTYSGPPWSKPGQITEKKAEETKSFWYGNHYEDREDSNTMVYD